MIQNYQLSSSKVETPNLPITPNLLWFVMQNNSAQVAWRRAILPKKHVASTHRHNESNAQAVAFPTHNKNKFTGSPAFKELKNLIVIILTSQVNQKGNS